MTFLERIGFIETPEQEQARLAQSPVGSTNHTMSQLPVTITQWPQDLLIQLPWDEPRTNESYTVVVVPHEFRQDLGHEEHQPRRRHGGSWDCIVVASDHPKYPVGGYRIVVSGAELARGTKVDLAQMLAEKVGLS